MKYKGIKINGKKHDVHRVVMEKHLGRKLTSKEVAHHKDGNTENNDIKNLELMSLSEHSAMHMKGSRPKKDNQRRGQESRGGAKLSIAHVKEIRQHLKCGNTQNNIAKMFSVNRSTVSKIKRRITWYWIT